MKRCVKCGYELSDNSKFCNECGEVQPALEQETTDVNIATVNDKIEKNSKKLDKKLLLKSMLFAVIVTFIVAGSLFLIADIYGSDSINNVESKNSNSNLEKIEQQTQKNTNYIAYTTIKPKTTTVPKTITTTTKKITTTKPTTTTTTTTMTTTTTTTTTLIPLGMSNALESAKSYIEFSNFSYAELVQQLEYEGYTHDEAVYGANNCGANWFDEALQSAKSYVEYSAFSYTELVQQLEYEEFTHDQALHGANNCGANWNEQAAKAAQSYLDYMSFSRQELLDQLIYEGFTTEQAEYGVKSVGY